MKKQLVYILFFIGLVGFAQETPISISADTTNIRIGEQIQFKISVNQTDNVVFPDLKLDSLGKVEVVENFPIDTLKDKLEKKYVLTSFDSGQYIVPRQQVLINNQQFLTDSLLLNVATVKVDTTKQKMFHIKPAFEVEESGFDFEKLFYWIVPILLIVGIIAFLFFRRRKRKKMELAKQLPPYEEAIEALKVLDHSHFLENDNSKSYYSSLTEILKRYIGREVDDAALESTSNELIDRLILHKDAGSFDFDAETINKIDKILKRADLIKFAKMKELEGQAKTDRTVVEDIINETKEIIPEPTEEELLKNKLYLEVLRKKQLKRKRIKIVLTAFASVIIAAVIFGSIKGFDELKDKISKTQTDKDGNLVILYTSNVNEQHSYVESAKAKGYEVLLLDSPIISHLIQKIETSNEKLNFTRVDSDVIEKLIKKDEKEVSKLDDKEKERLKTIIEEVVPKEKYTVQIEATDSSSPPFVITVPEFMRRMKEMQQSGGNGMFGNMPEMYNLNINVNNSICSEILNSKGKAKKERLINQSLDLAKLSQNLLKGEELTSFIKRSLDLIK